MSYTSKLRRQFNQFLWLQLFPRLFGDHRFLEKKSMADLERTRVRYVATFWVSLFREFLLGRRNILDVLDLVASMRWTNKKLLHYMYVNMTPYAKTPAYFDIMVQIPNVAGSVPFNLVSSRRAGGIGPLEEVEAVNNARIFCYLNKLQQLAYSR